MPAIAFGAHGKQRNRSVVPGRGRGRVFKLSMSADF